MNVHKFVAEKGVEEAKLVLRSAYTHCVYVKTPTHFDIEESVLVHENDLKEICEPYVDLKELKQVVESLDMVAKHGGLFRSKCQIEEGGYDFEWYGENGEFGFTDLNVLEKAIADYELVESYKQVKCEVLDMVDVSPNCEVRNG